MGEIRCQIIGTSLFNVFVVTAENCITVSERRTVWQNCDALNAGLSALAN